MKSTRNVQYLISAQWLTPLFISYLSMCVSGEREPLWLCEAEGDADLCQHGGPERADSHSPLWTVQTLQTGGDGIQRHRPRVQTRQVSSSLINTYVDMVYNWYDNHECVCSACSRPTRPSVRSFWWSCRSERTRWGRCLCRGWRRRSLSWRKLREMWVDTQTQTQHVVC